MSCFSETHCCGRAHIDRTVVAANQRLLALYCSLYIVGHLRTIYMTYLPTYLPTYLEYTCLLLPCRKYNISGDKDIANFKPLPLPTSPTALDWSFFKVRFADYIVLADMANASQDKLKALLLVSLGREGCEILEGLPDPKDTFDECNTRLDYFCGKSSTLLKRKTFLSAQQEQSETANAFVCRLRRLVSDCAFGGNKMTLLRDIFMIGVFNDRLGEKLLAEEEIELTFDLAVRKAEAFERARQERASSKSTLISAVRRLPNQHPGNMAPAASKPASTSLRRRACYRCGSSDHIASAATCPAVSAKCCICGKNGHFAKVCRSVNKATVNHIEETPQSDNSDDSGDFYSSFFSSYYINNFCFKTHTFTKS